MLLRKLFFLLVFSSTVVASNGFLNEESKKTLNRQLAAYRQEQSQKFHPSSQTNRAVPAVAQQDPLKNTPNSKKRTHATAFQANESALSQISEIADDVPVTSAPKRASLEKEAIHPVGQFTLKQLTTPQQHREFLLSAIHSAQSKILITSYTFHYDRPFIEALEAAARRNVKIYLYCDAFTVFESKLEYMEQLGMHISNLNIHSKIFSVDDKFVVIGSYNWLGNDEEGQNHSVILEGPSAKITPAKDYLWEYLKNYRTLSQENISRRTIAHFTQVFQAEKGYNISNDIILLTNPFQHQQFFEECFVQAQQKITICAPFITSSLDYLRDIMPTQRVQSFFQANRKLEIFYREGDQNIALLQSYFHSHFHNYANLIKWVSIRNLHKKTLIVDNSSYAISSFNWFSSARDLEDEFMFMETTFVFKGNSAKWLIESNPS